MLNCTSILSKKLRESDILRYKSFEDTPAELIRFKKDKKPIVVWNCTRTCNLHCVHCYLESQNQEYANELTDKQAMELIDDLAEYKAPVLLFSGGEPLMRKNVLNLIDYSVKKGIHSVISTNGLLIDDAMAKKLKELGVSYAGISLDGLEETHDKFRGMKGAFAGSLKAIDNCQRAGVKVGVRFTLNALNYKDLGGLMDLIKEKNIERLCIYHLVYAGRGSKLIKNDLTKEQTKEAVDLIFDKVRGYIKDNFDCEVLTVDNHTNAVYMYKQLYKEDKEYAREIYKMFKANGGNNSGIGLSNIDNEGNVHPDQFWQHASVGNVKERKFSEIWTDNSIELLNKLRNRKQYIKGKCSICEYYEICNGNMRVRAESYYDDLWQEDPACYLTEEELTNRTDF